METNSVRRLINSISRFIHLVSSRTIRIISIQQDYEDMVDVLKPLKPVLDDVVDYKIISDELLFKQCEVLDIVINEAREFMENWSPKMSKICCVLKSDSLLMKIQALSLEICQISSKLLQPSPCISSLAVVENCLQTLQLFSTQERVSEYIKEALRRQRDEISPCTAHLEKIIELLNLKPSQELLKERIAIEKERTGAKLNKETGEMNQIDRIVDLIICIRDWIARIDQYQGIVQVSVPPYFRCPLSSELMLDPVIVASGQTYDRSSIQKWLDDGLTVCPKTHIVLSHTNLVTNYTVKAMIENWCEEKNISLSNLKHNFVSISQPPVPVSQQDLISTNKHSPLNSSNFTSRSSLEAGNVYEMQYVSVSSRLNGDKSKNETEMYHSSSGLSYLHSRSESVSSAVSSIDYVSSALNDVMRISNVEDSAEITSVNHAAYSKKESGLSHNLAGENSQKKEGDKVENGFDELTTISHVNDLIVDLKSQRKEVQTKAAEELRLLAKHNTENRVIIGRGGAIMPLLSLLYSKVTLTQEHAVTALLNLSIDSNNKAMIAKADAIEPLIHVLKTGNDVARENSAAALFSLSVLEEYKAKIGRSDAVRALVGLLGSGTLRGKKDATTALFNLSIFHENKARIVQAGAITYLVDFLDPSTGMVDKAAALLANLSTISEGRLAIVREGGIPLLVEIVDCGSHSGKENSASILLQLCLHSSKFCTLILQEGAVPPLVALSQSGTLRAKEKAQQLLSHFRNQREGGSGKGKS